MKYNRSSGDEWDYFLLKRSIIKSRKKYFVHKLWQKFNDSGEFSNAVLKKLPIKIL